MIKPNIKKILRSDINAIELQTTIKGSYDLYRKLIVKYSVFDSSFENSVKPTLGKIGSFDEGFDYRPELKLIAEKLKLYLTLNKFPNQNLIKQINITPTINFDLF